MQTYGQQLRDEGRAEGIAEGRAQTLLRLMEKRFGSIPEAARRRIGVAATPAQLDAWLDALLGAQSVDEVLRAGSA